MGPSRANQQGTGTTPLKIMMEGLAENEHPVFRCSSRLTRGTLKRVLKTILAIGQLSIYGAVQQSRPA